MTVDTSSPGRRDGPAVPAGSRAVVTGAKGFIGGRLVETLVAQGASVTCLIRGAAGSRLERTGAAVSHVDAADAEGVREVLGGVDHVFHCAYDWSNEDWNHRALRALIAGCQANGCRLVHVSSFVVYDLPSSGEVTEATIDTLAGEGYSYVKLQLENELLDAVKRGEVQASIVQPTIVYGPGSQPWTVEPAEMLRNGVVVLPDQGQGVCNAVYVDDVVDGMIRAATQPAAVGQRYLISGEPVSWSEFYEGMARAAGGRRPVYLPTDVIRRAVSRRGRLMRGLKNPRRGVRDLANSHKVQKVLRAALRFTPWRVRSRVEHFLWGPASKQRGYLHMPDEGRLGFLTGTNLIYSSKARRELGYAPRVDFAKGVELTRPFLSKLLADARER